MRSVSQNALDVFSSSGIEPVILVKVFWSNGNGITYSDRKFEEYGFLGKLISIGTIDDVINIDTSGNSAQVSITLDDSDGSLKQIFNTSDIHKVPVQLLQWSTELNVNEAFVIFQGQINSPIEWKEGDRTLSFDVVSLIEDKQVGFAVEDGRIPLYPSKLIGKAWPVVFGKVAGVPALQISELPSAILQESFGLMDPTVWQKEFNDLEAERINALSNASEANQKAFQEALIASRYRDDWSTFTFGTSISGPPDDPSTAESHDNASRDYYAQASAFIDEATLISKKISQKHQLFNEQKNYDRTEFLRIFSRTMPEGVPLTFKLGGCTYTGSYINGGFFISSRKFPEDFNNNPRINLFVARIAGKIVVSSQTNSQNGQTEYGPKFQWIDAGTEIKVQDFPLSYVVSVSPVQISSVWGYRRGIRMMLPPGYYNIEYRALGGTTGTFINVFSALSTRTKPNGESEGWDNDQIEVDCTSTIGPNTVDIIAWIITLFTKFKIDAASFALVRFLVNSYPMNFVLLEKKNVVTLLQELAFQARCSIWLNGDTFFIRYLPLPPESVDTITDDDILLNSLIVTCTETENLITHFIATWKPNLFQDDFKVIYDYNIPKYGFKEGSYNFYAYNDERFVQRSAEFWLIRRANTFKILKFKTTLHKIRLESFDAVTIDIEPGIVSNQPVVGTILKAIYNTKDKTIDMEVWLPIRFGEMDPYLFAEPYNVDSVYPLIHDPNLKTENPFAVAGSIPGTPVMTTQHIPKVTNGQPYSWGRGLPMSQDGPPPDYGIIGNPIVYPATIGKENLLKANDYDKHKVNPVAVPVITNQVNATFPGLINATVNKDTQLYEVNVYFNGFNNPVTKVQVKQFKVATDEELPSGTPVLVHRLVWKDNDDLQQTTLWMQAPIWIPPPVEQTT